MKTVIFSSFIGIVVTLAFWGAIELVKLAGNFFFNIKNKIK